VLSEDNDGRIVFFDFEPTRGKGRKLGDIDATATRSWQLSPDGGRIVSDTVEEDGNVRLDVLDLESGSSRDLAMDVKRRINRPAWSASGDCLYACVQDQQSFSILRIEMDGRTRLLPVQGDIMDTRTFLMPSTDGNRFVFAKEHRESTIWMLDNP
jgi:Tol biopolymer transport system component